MMFSLYTIILVIGCAIFYYRAGEYEETSGLGWAALSILISCVIWLWLHGGFLAVFLGQVGLFVAITLYRCVRSNDQAPPRD